MTDPPRITINLHPDDLGGPGCDFCGGPNITWTYPCEAFDLPEPYRSGSSGDWAACDPCSAIIETVPLPIAGNPAAGSRLADLAQRSIDRIYPQGPPSAQELMSCGMFLYALHTGFFAHRKGPRVRDEPEPAAEHGPFNLEAWLDSFTVSEDQHPIDPASPLGQAMAAARGAEPIDPETFTVTPTRVSPEREAEVLGELRNDDNGHAWSGWPGAWCFHCGAEDVTELCVAEHPEAYGAEVTEQNPFGMRTHCVNPPCPEPGSNRHNPYGRGLPKGDRPS